MKLTVKINVFTTLVASIILAISFIAIYYTYKNLAIDTEVTQLMARADDFATALSSLDTTNGIDTLFRTYLPTDGYLVATDEDDEVLIRMQATNVPMPQLQTMPTDPYELFRFGGINHLVAHYPLLWPGDGIAYAHFIQPIPLLSANLTSLKIILITLMLFSIIPIYLASSLLARIISKPITALTSVMARNIKNQTYEKIPLEAAAKDELAQMTKTYNSLMHELEAQNERQQQFIGNASHELKTPLTVIESYAKLLKRRGFENKEITNEAIDAITEQSDSMKQLIDQMLNLANSTEMKKLDVTEVNLLTLLQSVRTQMLRQVDQPITITCNEAITIVTDEQKLKQLLFIFIDNAKKYSDQSTPIYLLVQPNSQSVTISIRDYGIGIPDQDIPHIFDRFYRVAKDRNRKTGGTGLGLAIAKQLASLIQAQLEVDSIVGKGTTFHIHLPRRLEVSE